MIKLVIYDHIFLSKNSSSCILDK